MADPRAPVRERGPRSAAAPEGRRRVLGERAGLADVLGRDPEAAPVDHRRAVVTPAGTRRVREVEDKGPTEAVRWAAPFGRHLQRTSARGAERGERRARIVVVSDEGEGPHAPPVGVHGDRRIVAVVVRDTEVALAREPRPVLTVWTYDEPLDAGLGVAVGV